jgi:septum formation protein
MIEPAINITRNPMKKPSLVLASTSRYRALLLERLKLSFITISPEVDEAASTDERCSDTALRLAIAKAVAGAKKSTLTTGLVIGSDQVCELKGVALAKPGSTVRAYEQLVAMRGKTLTFHTALALHNIATGATQSTVVPTEVVMRDYLTSEIQFYLENEDALDCAGSAKSEGLGVALIESMTSADPTALVGLPLIALTRMLAREGVGVLS